MKFTLFAICGLAVSANAQMACISQSRSVSASVTDGTTTIAHTENASNFSGFNREVVSEMSPGTARGFQDSTIDAGTVHATLDVGAVGSAGFHRTSTGLSTFELVFSIDHPETATLVCNGYSSAWFSLTGVGVDTGHLLNGSVTVYLAPGTYTLAGNASYISASAPPYGADVEATLTIPSAGPAVLAIAGMLVIARRSRR